MKNKILNITLKLGTGFSEHKQKMNTTTTSKKIPQEMIAELIQDIKNDGGLHNGLIFNEWRRRNNMNHIQIKDVSYLFTINPGKNAENFINKSK